jgi:hypothetical protein
MGLYGEEQTGFVFELQFYSKRYEPKVSAFLFKQIPINVIQFCY